MHDGPQPATRTFVLQPGARRFYVIPGRHEARAGRFGHYLRPYTVTTSFETNPFPLPQALVQRGENLDYYTLGVPGVPWPSIEQQGSDWCNRVEAIGYYFLDGHACADRQVYRAGDSYKQLSFLGPDGDKDPYFPPDPTYAMNGRDYVRCTGDQAYSEIGRETLMEAVAEGERLDLAFARRMAGLLGVNMDAVWDCLDPGFNPADRQAFACVLGFPFALGWLTLRDAGRAEPVPGLVHQGLLRLRELQGRHRRQGCDHRGAPAAQDLLPGLPVRPVSLQHNASRADVRGRSGCTSTTGASRRW